MTELRELLEPGEHRAPFTSDDPIQSWLRRPSLRVGDEDALIKLAILFRAFNPAGTWRDFTRWIA